MKRFDAYDIGAAMAHAATGGQAVHVHKRVYPRSPACLRREVARGRDIATLFDRDRERLVATARRLGLAVVLVERDGHPGQHVALMGASLRRALEECKKEE